MYDKDERVVADLTKNTFTSGQPVTAHEVFDDAFRRSRETAKESFDNIIRFMDGIKDWILTVLENSLPENVMPITVTPGLYSHWNNPDRFFQMLASENLPVVVEFSATDGRLYCVVLRCNKQPDGTPDTEHVYALVMRRDPKTGVQDVKTETGWEKAE